MFDSITHTAPLPVRRLGSSAAVVVFLHAAAVLLAIAIAKPRGVVEALPPGPLIFVPFLPPPAPPPQGGPKTPARHHHAAKAQALLIPKASEDPVKQDAPAAPEPVSERDPESPGEPGGGPGGTEGGTPFATGTCVGPMCGVVGQPVVPTWTPEMTPPRKLSGPDPEYTPEALEHEVEGRMQVRCIVGVDGHVSGCRILQSLPFMDRSVIEALERRLYLPAELGGRPIAVDYLFDLHLRLPD